MPKKNLFTFNIKNLKYAFADAGVYDSPVDLAYANSLSLEADYDELVLYGDGQKLAILADDKGKTGTLSVINLDELYEIACGRMMEVEGGIADVQQLATLQHALYYEVDILEDGIKKTVKNWLYGCTTGKAGESFEQTQDNPTVNNYEYPLTVLGINLLATGGLTDYVDANGNTVKVYRTTAYPDDTGYTTFGDTVPVPTTLV
ncbi:MAG: hypothetical protein PF487_13375 [Bacteroidales bacterium]|jgi:hypothetical protein|nr:hypothetical protein [Bacteroidales bacterium]